MLSISPQISLTSSPLFPQSALKNKYPIRIDIWISPELAVLLTDPHESHAIFTYNIHVVELRTTAHNQTDESSQMECRSFEVKDQGQKGYQRPGQGRQRISRSKSMTTL